MNGATCDGSPAATLEQLAQKLVDLEIVREILRAQILTRMVNEEVQRIDVPGGQVVYVRASSSMVVDAVALGAKVEKLGAELRALGRDPDDGLPMKPSARRAGIRVNL